MPKSYGQCTDFIFKPKGRNDILRMMKFLKEVKQGSSDPPHDIIEEAH